MTKIPRICKQSLYFLFYAIKDQNGSVPSLFAVLYHMNVRIINSFYDYLVKMIVSKKFKQFEATLMRVVFYGLLLSAKKMSSRKKSFRADIKNHLKLFLWYVTQKCYETYKKRKIRLPNSKKIFDC